MAKIGVE